MRAARLVEWGKPLQVMDIDVPKIKGREVLVKVEAAGVCHSDVHIRDGFFGRISMVALGRKLPITLGHEIAGVIAEMGDEVQGLSKGDRVVVYPWIGDGTCHYCRIGEEHLCDNPRWLGIYVDGGYAEYVKVPDYKYIIKIKNVDSIHAASLTCAGITTYRAARKAGIKPHDVVGIVGAGGGLGSMVIQMVKAIASSAIVIGIDVKEEALKIAEQAGADFVINSKDQSMAQEIKRLTEGRGFDVVIDLVDSEHTLNLYPQFMARGGRYVMVGLFGADLHYHAPLITLNEVQFIGTKVGNFQDFMETILLAERGKIKPIITRIRKLEEINEALDDIKYGRVEGRQVVIP